MNFIIHEMFCINVYSLVFGHMKKKNKNIHMVRVDEREGIFLGAVLFEGL